MWSFRSWVLRLPTYSYYVIICIGFNIYYVQFNIFKYSIIAYLNFPNGLSLLP